MAKMFYSLDEVTAKLGKSEDEIREMIASGQLSEFRDRDRLMFKVEQVDLLAGGDDEPIDNLSLTLEDSVGGSGIDFQSGDTSSIGLADSAEDTGISVFDVDANEDASEQTQIGDTMEEELNLESIGSGSGLLDLTRESDDTALGAELLEEVYSSDDNIEIPANASGLFEAAGAESPGNVVSDSAIGAMPMVFEAYDGSGSGLGIGMMLGAAAALVCALIIGIVGVTGATPGLAMQMADNLWLWVGGLAGAVIVFGLIGFFIGKATE
ncbi:MAG: hypothetical protein KDA25_04390 [Phycisphaerales bacterium]|nr:hypothetical protein [Phycisphaerales bacterium]